MITELRPVTEISQRAIHLLYKALGVVHTVHFLKQFTLGVGDYPKERGVLSGSKTADSGRCGNQHKARPTFASNQPHSTVLRTIPINCEVSKGEGHENRTEAE